jgi:FkbM family methyltransferase
MSIRRMYYIQEGSESTETPLFISLPPAPSNPSQPQPMFFPEKSVAQWFFKSGMAEKPLIQWATDTYVRSDKVFLDIGAHVGTYSWICGRKAKHTYAFECSAKTFCFLAANIALHNLTDKITPVRCALGPSAGTTQVLVRSADGGGNGVKSLSSTDTHVTQQSIDMRTLDSFNLSEIGFIKLDVEGFEKEVLQGAVETLRRSNWPPILFESWGDWKEREGVPASALRKDLFLFLESLDYSIHPIRSHSDMYVATHR